MIPPWQLMDLRARRARPSHLYILVSGYTANKRKTDSFLFASHWEKDYLPQYDQTRAIKWSPTFMISKQRMFAGIVEEIFLTFDNQTKAINGDQLLWIAYSICLLVLLRKSF